MPRQDKDGRKARRVEAAKEEGGGRGQGIGSQGQNEAVDGRRDPRRPEGEFRGETSEASLGRMSMGMVRAWGRR